MDTQKNTHRLLMLLCLGFVTVTSYFTYVHRYTEPQAPFWDENYYITDAQRMMNGTFFMQIHPPLGKMLIALGEKLMNANADDTQFLNVEHAAEFPKDFSFRGYRLFPVLMGWGTAILFFFCFLLLTGNPLIAALLSFLPIFDNALLVHSRGAMLDAPLNFFLVLALLLFLLLMRTKRRDFGFLALGASLAIAMGLAVTTKASGLILILLIPPLLWHLRKERNNALGILFVGLFSFLITFLGIWHLSLGRMETINPALRNNGYYETSDAYKAILQEGRQNSLLALPLMIMENLRYTATYNKGIPKLDLCKPDENGSPVFLWPIGATTINYRWASNGETYQYLYLVANPAVWFAGLAGVLLAGVCLLSSLFLKEKRSEERQGNILLMITFFSLYLCYMTVFNLMDRVNFLYTYFPALLFSFFLIAIVVTEAQRIGAWILTEERKTLLVMALACAVFLSFQFFRPLTYYEPLTNEQVEARSLLRIWNLRCVSCEKPSPLVRRQCSEGQ